MERPRRFGWPGCPHAVACLLLALLLGPPLSGSARGETVDAVSRQIADTLCVIRECPPCIVRIEINPKDAQAVSGTGILLKDGRILTTAHLLRTATDQQRPHVWFGGRGGRPAVDGADGRSVTWKCSTSVDLAVLTGVAVPPWAGGASLAAAPPKKGDLLTAVGVEPNGAVRVYAGTLLELQGDSSLLALGLTTQKGDSGGPVFNLAGAVVGIVSGGGKFTRTTTSTETVAGGVVETTEKREVPASFAVDLSKVDWKGF